jgi:transposase
MTNSEVGAALNQVGHRTGKPVDRVVATNLCYAHRIGAPDLLAAGELTPRAAAQRLGVGVGVVHGWLSAGTLPARRSPTGRWCIPFPAEVEEDCRARIATSPHLHHDADGLDWQPGEMSISEVAKRRTAKADVVYYWAERGYLPTRLARAGDAGSPSPTRSKPPRWNPSGSLGLDRVRLFWRDYYAARGISPLA